MTMKLNIQFEDNGWDDYQYWVNNDRKKLKKINKLIDACRRDPFEGEGKPEPLKDNLAGFWSRRIDLENRLVYTVIDDILYIAQCRYHYNE